MKKFKIDMIQISPCWHRRHGETFQNPEKPKIEFLTIPKPQGSKKAWELESLKVLP